VPLRLLRLLTFVLLLQLSHGFDAFGAGAGGGRQPDTEFYDTLDLAPDCSPADIKKAYRNQALKNHPDKGGDPEKFKKINEAYAVLSDEQKRAAYDRMGKAAVDGSMPGGMGGGMGGMPGGMGGGFPGGFAFGGGMGGMSAEDIFAQVFGQAMGGGGRAGGFGAGFGQPRMRDQEMTMPVTLEELYLGGTKRVAIRRPYISNGAIREERVEVEIPLHPGTRDGARFSIPGGAPHKANVIVVIKTRPHGRFRRMGDDLVCQFELTLLEALTGFRSSLRHLDGRTLNLACDGEVTRPGHVRRVRGCGMPRRRAGGKGDLLLRFSVRFPEDPISGEAAKVLKQLLPRDAGSVAPVQPGERMHRLETVELQGEEEQGDSWGF